MSQYDVPAKGSPAESAKMRENHRQELRAQHSQALSNLAKSMANQYTVNPNLPANAELLQKTQNLKARALSYEELLEELNEYRAKQDLEPTEALLVEELEKEIRLREVERKEIDDKVAALKDRDFLDKLNEYRVKEPVGPTYVPQALEKELERRYPKLLQERKIEEV